MKLPHRTTLLALTTTAVLAIGAAGAALAQDGPGEGRPTTGESSEVRRPHHHPFRLSLYEIVEASGIDSEVFREGFANGQSINDTLTANGADPAAIQAAVLADLEARLTDAVTAGDMDQARANEILANSTERLAAFMASPNPGVRLHAARGVLASAAETIGIGVRELLDEVRESDGTIASVAEVHGVAPQTVIDEAVANILERLAEAEANGNIIPERAAEIRESAPERVAEFVNEGPRFKR